MFPAALTFPRLLIEARKVAWIAAFSSHALFNRSLSTTAVDAIQVRTFAKRPHYQSQYRTVFYFIFLIY
jgi:hypothetical protein